MKRGQFDSEYDKIRRRAGYDKPKYEFPDEAADIEAQWTARRVADLNEDFKARMVALNEADHKRAEELALNREKFIKETNRRIMLEEWSRAGVEPPVPLVSLALARSLGCWIEEVCGEKVLRIPERKSGGPVKRREDYGNVEGS